MKWTTITSLQEPLNTQIEQLKNHFPTGLLGTTIEGVLIIGSVSRAVATYRSDLDILAVLCQPPLTYGRTVDLRDKIEKVIPSAVLSHPLPVQLHFILPAAFDTGEKAMFDALRSSFILLDIGGRVAEMRKKRLLNRDVA